MEEMDFTGLGLLDDLVDAMEEFGEELWVMFACPWVAV